MRGFAPNPTRELSSIDLPLSCREATASNRFVQNAAKQRRESDEE